MTDYVTMCPIHGMCGTEDGKCQMCILHAGGKILIRHWNADDEYVTLEDIRNAS